MHAIYELNLMLLLKNVRYDVAQFVAKTYSVSINMFDRSIAHIRFGIHFSLICCMADNAILFLSSVILFAFFNSNMATSDPVLEKIVKSA